MQSRLDYGCDQITAAMRLRTFALADAATTDEELDEKAEGEAVALVTAAPRREAGSREVG